MYFAQAFYNQFAGVSPGVVDASAGLLPQPDPALCRSLSPEWTEGTPKIVPPKGGRGRIILSATGRVYNAPMHDDNDSGDFPPTWRPKSGSHRARLSYHEAKIDSGSLKTYVGAYESARASKCIDPDLDVDFGSMLHPLGETDLSTQLIAFEVTDKRGRTISWNNSHGAEFDGTRFDGEEGCVWWGVRKTVIFPAFIAHYLATRNAPPSDDMDSEPLEEEPEEDSKPAAKETSASGGDEWKSAMAMLTTMTIEEKTQRQEALREEKRQRQEDKREAQENNKVLREGMQQLQASMQNQGGRISNVEGEVAGLKTWRADMESRMAGAESQFAWVNDLRARFDTDNDHELGEDESLLPARAASMSPMKTTKRNSSCAKSNVAASARKPSKRNSSYADENVPSSAKKSKAPSVTPSATGGAASNVGADRSAAKKRRTQSNFNTTPPPPPPRKTPPPPPRQIPTFNVGVGGASSPKSGKKRGHPSLKKRRVPPGVYSTPPPQVPPQPRFQFSPPGVYSRHGGYSTPPPVTSSQYVAPQNPPGFSFPSPPRPTSQPREEEEVKVEEVTSDDEA